MERRLSPNTVAAYRRDVEALAVFQTRSHATLPEATRPSLRRFVAQQAGVPPFRESELQPTGAPPEPLQRVSVRENSVVFGPLTRGSWLGVRRTLRFPAPTKKRAIRAA